MRLVLDTSVLVAAMRSSLGVSRVLVSAAIDAEFELVISTALVLEYESVLTRPEQLSASGLDANEIAEFIDAICAIGIEARKSWNWRPQLTDPDDEMVLEAAMNGRADAIVTFNRAHFLAACRKFGIGVLSPREARMRLRSR